MVEKMPVARNESWWPIVLHFEYAAAPGADSAGAAAVGLLPLTGTLKGSSAAVTSVAVSISSSLSWRAAEPVGRCPIEAKRPEVEEEDRVDREEGSR